MPKPATLFLVGMPIGNVDDLSPLARAVLSGVDVIAAEDTRKAEDIFKRAGVTFKRLITLHAHNEEASAQGIIKLLSQGQSVAFVSDAGMPGISDPGEKLVREVTRAGFGLDVVSGPCAALHALVLSGLPTGHFSFLGFLPRGEGDLKRRLEEVRMRPDTLLFYESPRRVIETLSMMQEVLGNRQASMARELTKTYQEVLRGDLASIEQQLKQRPEVLGEITIVVQGMDDVAMDAESMEEAVKKLLADGLSPKEIKAQLAKKAGWPGAEVYAVAVKLSKN
jgi:16S rRNA (cytidine1402-2'-O)-methyltransferase